MLNLAKFLKNSVILITLTSVSCGKLFKKKEQESPPDKIALVIEKRNLYNTLSKNHLDQFNFIMHEQCDSILFTSLMGAVAGLSVDITAARDSDGKWTRRALEKPCYPKGAASTISRDMFLGIFWYIWRNKRLDLATELFQYGRDHDWIMGEGDVFRIYMTPGLQATLAEIIYKLGGTNHTTERNYPNSWGSVTGFEAHLMTLHILLRGELTGSITEPALERVKSFKDAQPSNGLFSYAVHLYTDGDQNEALDVLLNESLFPSNALPTSSNYCTDWLWQRDQYKDWVLSGDWTPCPDENKEYSGGDYLVLAGLLLGSGR